MWRQRELGKPRSRCRHVRGRDAPELCADRVHDDARGYLSALEHSPVLHLTSLRARTSPASDSLRNEKSRLLARVRPPAVPSLACKAQRRSRRARRRARQLLCADRDGSDDVSSARVLPSSTTFRSLGDLRPSVIDYWKSVDIMDRGVETPSHSNHEPSSGTNSSTSVLSLSLGMMISRANLVVLDDPASQVRGCHIVLRAPAADCCRRARRA